jgi:hypothetical protein
MFMPDCLRDEANSLMSEGSSDKTAACTSQNKNYTNASQYNDYWKK